MNQRLIISKIALPAFLFFFFWSSAAYADAKQIVEHTVRSGDSAYTVSKKLLSQEQHKNFASWLSQTSIGHIKPKDTVRFELQGKRVVSFAYGSGASIKQFKLGNAQPSSTQTSPAPLGTEKKITVNPGDNLMSIAKRHAFPSKVQAHLLKRSSDLQSIRPKDMIHIRWDDQHKVTHLSVEHSKTSITPTKTSITPKKATQLAHTQRAGYQMTSLHVRRHFRDDARAAGVPVTVVRKIEDIYQHTPKALQLLKAGARLEIVYEPKKNKGHELTYVRLSYKDKNYEAIRYHTSHGVSYYDAQGKPYEQSFLRIPLGTHKLSSPFSLGRKHPILGRVRPHYGVDFSAKPGTPVWASGSGTVVFAGYQRGYGRVIKIRHSPSVTTLYAHLSKFEPGMAPGTRVSQKQVVGYVGSSGLSTGPHLHYEYHINDQPRDPMTVALGHAKPLKKSERVSLLAQRKQWIAMTNQPSV